MYVPPAFAESDPAWILGFLRANSFGTLITAPGGAIRASLVPFVAHELEGVLVLDAHLAAANPQSADIASGEAASALFLGAHAYVSPSWYRGGPAVPTWNYEAVEVAGRLAPLDAMATEAMMDSLTAEDPGGFRLAALPETYRRRMMGGITAFRLVATRVDAKRKLSQNRAPADRMSVAAALRPDAPEMARLIEATLPA